MDILEWLDVRKKNTDYAKRQRVRRLTALYVAAVCLVMLIIGLVYTTKSKIIYFWDDATYWDMSRAVLSGSIKDSFWSSVYNSIGTSDYNYIAALPSAAWMYIFGASRTSYVAGLIVMYLFPTVGLIYRLAVKLSKAPRTAFTAAICLVPAMLYIADIGFADVGGLVMMLGCYNLSFTEPEKEEGLLRYIAMGALFIFSMVFRRYYSFFAVSFLTAMVMDCILFGKRWRNVITAGITSAVILVGAFMPFVTDVLLRNYSELYSGYKFPLMTDIRFITRYFGLIFILAAAAVPVLSSAMRKDHRPIFVWMQLIICAAMFIATQTHGTQHMLLYVPAFMILALFLINCITKRWMLIAALLLSVCSAVSPYIKRDQPQSIREIQHVSLFPSFSMRPKKLDNAYDVVQVKRKLDEYIPEGAECRVMASSFLINDSILRNAEASLDLKETRDGSYIAALPYVDSRDKDRLDEIYYADYILVAFPAQTHLEPGSQTIITEGVRSFANYADIAMSFEEMPGFDEWIGDIELKLYHRKVDINTIWKNEFKKRLFNASSD
ncbi:MAG: hypothetical protein IJH94_01130 [Clostridia bacterium]|nr:hypothetical protein [Clostridia bacterium]